MIQKSLFVVLASCLLASASVTANDHDPGQFQHHPDIRIEPFAQEPDVVDPVSLTFAPNGDCYVVEMRDYPYGVGAGRQPGGTIRLLRDRDGDGRADESKLFASGLSFPTSVMAWRDGILVLAPPEIRFLRDTDGDDQADINEVVIKGLKRGVTDSNANSLRWGVDNWIHCANGGNGGKVKMIGSDQPALALGNSDFAFDLDTKKIVRTSRTGGGFGLVFDDFGNSFTTHNLDYLQQRIIPSRYIDQSPEMFSFAATENISDHGISARIYPIVQAVTRVNHPEQAGHFSSSGGMGILNSSLFSARLANSIFVCDVVCNIVHRDVLREDGPTFRAARAAEEQNREFIASRDAAFRPVGLEPGPDGAMYLIDMQRDVIEHPDYIPAKVRETLDLRAGQDRGRIYRVIPQAGLLQLSSSLADKDSSELVAALNSPAPWHRETAHRLLVEQNDPSSVPRIQREAWQVGAPETRVRAMWILHHLGVDVDLLAAIHDQEPQIGAQAVLILERLRNRLPGTAVALANAKKLHPRVQFQIALTLDSSLRDSELDADNFQLANDQIYKSLMENLRQGYQNKWSRRAVLISADHNAARLLKDVWESEWFLALSGDGDKLVLANELANVTAATRDNDSSFAVWLEELNLQQYDSSLVRALLSGLQAGWSRRPETRLQHSQIAAITNRWASANITGYASELIDLISLYQLDYPENLTALFSKSRAEASDTALDEKSRIAAIRILGRDNDVPSFDLLMELLSAPETTSIQQAAIEAIGRMQRSDAGERLLAAWSAMLPGIRGSVIQLLLSRREYQESLLTALENGDVQFSELNLDLEQRRRMLRWSSIEIGRRSAKLFGDEEYSNRKAIVAEWLEKLPATADVSEGRVLFEKKCSSCHIAGTTGNRVGPDLRALSHRSVEDLLTHILDPNMSINPNYVSCVVETVDGQIINGLLAAETTDSITLKQAEGKSQTISRADIQQLKTLKTSLMPEGLEKEVTPQQMRSLIAYLQEN